jgi:hypothetical protein
MSRQRGTAQRSGSEPGSARPASAVAKPDVRRGSPLLKLQRTIGNKAVQRLVRLQQADSEMMQDDMNLSTHLDNGMNSPGHPLDDAAREFMEQSFGVDFSGVRLHTDAAAGRSADAFNAKAYTVGPDIVFGDGQYSPDSSEGQRLIAHELTHVVQQQSGPVAGTLAADGSLSISDPEDSFEQAADAQAERVLGSGTSEAKQSPSQAATGVSVQRDDNADDDVDQVVGAAGVPHAGVELYEGAQATKESVETAKGITESFEGLEDTFGPLPATVTAAAEGSPTLADTAAAAQIAQASGEGALGGVPGATLGNALAPLALGAGIYDDTKAIEDMSKHGANLENTPELVQGTLEATSGGIGTLGLAGAGLSALGATGAGGAAAGAAAAAAPVGMVAGAGALGMLAGKEMGDLADSSYTKTGAFGVDPDTGKNQSAMDWGSNWGTWVDKKLGNTDPSVLGGIAAGAGGIVGGIGGALYGAGNWLSDKI